MRKEFKSNTPELILIVCGSKKDDCYEKAFQKGLDQLDKPYAALSIYVKQRDLKNMLSAIRLMDVKGLFITGKHQKHGRLFADSVEDKGLTNTVIFKKGRYYGYNLPLREVEGKKGGKGRLYNLPHLAAAAIKLWTGKTIDIKKLSRQITRLGESKLTTR